MNIVSILLQGLESKQHRKIQSFFNSLKGIQKMLPFKAFKSIYLSSQ